MTYFTVEELDYLKTVHHALLHKYEKIFNKDYLQSLHAKMDNIESLMATNAPYETIPVPTKEEAYILFLGLLDCKVERESMGVHSTLLSKILWIFP